MDNTTFFKSITHHEKHTLALKALWRAILSQGTYSSDRSFYLRFQPTPSPAPRPPPTNGYHANLIPILIFLPSPMKYTFKSQANQQRMQSFFHKYFNCKHSKYLETAWENLNPMHM